MCSPGRLIAAGLLTALAEFLTAAVLLAVAGPQQLSWTLMIAAVLTAALSLASRPLLRPRDDPRGGPGQRPRGPPPGPPEPPWWPEFEREFRRYEGSRPRTRALAGRR